jgi:hypothetical protein
VARKKRKLLLLPPLPHLLLLLPPLLLTLLQPPPLLLLLLLPPHLPLLLLLPPRSNRRSASVGGFAAHNKKGEATASPFLFPTPSD